MPFAEGKLKWHAKTQRIADTLSLRHPRLVCTKVHITNTTNKTTKAVNMREHGLHREREQATG